MDYRKASSIRKKSLLSLIAENKFEKDQGLGSSIGTAISDKFKAKAVGIKEKFDPLNWVSAITGKGTFGKVATTLAGRAFGRGEEDIQYFGGYARKNRKDDPQRTNIGPGRVVPLRVGDSTADILAKMYNLSKISFEKDKTQKELEVAFRKEQMEEDERRHKKLIDELLKSYGKKGNRPEVTDVRKHTSLLEDVEEFFGRFIEKLKSYLTPFLELLSNLKKTVLGILGEVGKKIWQVLTNLKFVKFLGKMFYEFLFSGPILKKIGQKLASFFRTLLVRALPQLGFAMPFLMAAEEKEEIEKDPYDPKYKDNPYAMYLRGEAPSESAAAKKNTKKTIKQLRPGDAAAFVESDLSEEEVINETGYNREQLSKYAKSGKYEDLGTPIKPEVTLPKEAIGPKQRKSNELEAIKNQLLDLENAGKTRRLDGSEKQLMARLKIQIKNLESELSNMPNDTKEVKKPKITEEQVNTRKEFLKNEEEESWSSTIDRLMKENPIDFSQEEINAIINNNVGGKSEVIDPNKPNVRNTDSSLNQCQKGSTARC
jgi:hypothetical protein